MDYSKLKVFNPLPPEPDAWIATEIATNIHKAILPDGLYWVATRLAFMPDIRRIKNGKWMIYDNQEPITTHAFCQPVKFAE